MDIYVLLMIGVLGGSAMSGQAVAQACDPAFSQQLVGHDGEVLGSSIVIKDDWAIVGAYLGVADGVDSGVAYLYGFDGEQWVESGKIWPPDGASEDFFGLHIAVDQSRMLISSRGYDDAFSNVGLVYAYELIDGEWVFEQKLSPINGVEDGGFGIVEIKGSRAAIGAPGRVFGTSIGSVTIFEHDGERWNMIEEIVPADGQGGDLFGISVSLHGDRMVVGSSDDFDENQWSFAGSAYVYEFDGKGWVEQAKLMPIDLFESSSFGRWVWLDGDRAVVGASGALNNVGRVYCYGIEDGQWVVEQVIEPETPTINGFFGVPFAIDCDVMVVSSASSENNEAFVYRLVDGAWIPAGVLEKNGTEPFDKFGAVLDIHDQTAMLIGLSSADSAGSVQIYDLGCSECVADLDGDWVLDIHDVEAFLAFFGAGDVQADFNGDGILNFFDVSAFLAAFSAGCP